MTDLKLHHAEGAEDHMVPPAVPDHEIYPRIIARGACGRVYLARNVMGTWRAVKVVYRSSFDKDRPYEREFEAIRRFEPVSRTHPSQVSILQVGRNEAAGYFYYVMELADDASRFAGRALPADPASGCLPQPVPADSGAGAQLGVLDPSSYVPHTLASELKRRGRLSFEECLNVGLALSTALSHLHKHELVHRDVKPANIVFVNGMAKLADIGLVAGAGAQTMVGTEGYIPPEGPGEPPADVFGLGKVLYEMMTGLDRTEFPKLPPNFAQWQDHGRWLELNNVVLKAASHDAARRYPNAARLHADLLNVQAGESPRWHRAQRKMFALKVALVAVASVSLLALAVLFHLNGVAREARRSVLIRDAKMIRVGERVDGQSGPPLEKLRQAAQVRVDNDLRSEIVATLMRPDPKFAHVATNTPAQHLAFDGSGRLLLSDGGGGGSARIWDCRLGQTTTLASTNSGPVWFGEDQTPLQFCYLGNGTFGVVEMKRATTRHTLSVDGGGQGQSCQLVSMAISRGGRFCGAALTIGSVQSVTVWESDSGRQIASIRESCSALAISPEGGCLAVGDSDGHVRVWSLPVLAPIMTFQQDRGSILCLKFHEDLTRSEGLGSLHPWLLAAGDGGGKVHVYQLRTSRLKSSCLGSSFRVNALAFSSDGMTLATGGHREVRIWDLGTGRLAAKLMADDVTDMAFSPDGVHLAANRYRGIDSKDDPAIWIAAVAHPTGASVLGGLSSETARLAFSRDGGFLAALSHNWEVGIWTTSSHRLLKLLEVPKGTIDNAALAFSPDGRRLAFATSGHASLWDIDSGMVIRAWPLPRGLDQWVRFDESGQLLHFQWERSSSGSSGICRTRQLHLQDDAKLLAEFTPPFHGMIQSSALSSDGHFVAVGGDHVDGAKTTRKFGVFETLTGTRLTLPCLPDNAECFSFDPSGNLLAFMDIPTATTSVCQLPQGKVMSRHVSSFMALGPGARRMVRSDCALVEAGNKSSALTLGLDWNPRSCLFSSDDRWLALGTSEGAILLYDVQELPRQQGQVLSAR